MLHQDIVQFRAQAQEFFGLNLNIGYLSLGTTKRLVKMDSRMGEGISLAYGSRS